MQSWVCRLSNECHMEKTRKEGGRGARVVGNCERVCTHIGWESPCLRQACSCTLSCTTMSCTKSSAITSVQLRNHGVCPGLQGGIGLRVTQHHVHLLVVILVDGSELLKRCGAVHLCVYRKTMASGSHSTMSAHLWCFLLMAWSPPNTVGLSTCV